MMHLVPSKTRKTTNNDNSFKNNMKLIHNYEGSMDQLQHVLDQHNKDIDLYFNKNKSNKRKHQDIDKITMTNIPKPNSQIQLKVNKYQMLDSRIPKYNLNN